MATTNKLNKVSLALRHGGGYQRKLMCASTLLTLMAFPVIAEQETEQKTDAEEIEVIEVRGAIQRTMTRSLSEKKNNTAIVDAIAAADFGELPGLSLSDVIENISGASGHRLKGSQNEISIRGLGSYWGYSTFNGRTITNAGPGRAVNFKKFPSELVDKVVIYKSQQADLVEGGTSGTIDVNSLRAVDYGESESTVQVSGIYNDYYNDVDGGSTSPWGGKILASTVQQWDTDDYGSMGFTIGLNHSDSANPEENYGGNSQMSVCALRAADGSSLIGGSNCATGQQGVSAGRVGRQPEIGIDTNLEDFDKNSIFYVPNDAYWRTGEDEDIRTGAVFTFQWVPNDKLNINLDYEHSDLEYTEKRMELALDTRLDDLADHIISSDHTLLYATGEARPTLQGEYRNQEDEYRGGGIEIEYEATDDLTMALDVSYSKSYRYRVRHRSKFRSTERYNYGLDFRGRNVPTLTWLDSNRLGPDDSGFSSWEAFDASYMGNFVNDGHAYAEYRRTHEERKDDILAFDLSGVYQLDNDYFSSIKAGVRYSEEDLVDYVNNDVSLSLSSGEQVYGASDNEDNNWDGLNPEANTALINGIIDNCTNNHSNDIQFTEETGDGGDATRYATYDHKCFIGQMLGQLPGATGTDYYDIGERADGRDGGDRDVEEKITAAYIMANIDTEIAGMPVFGNIGMRVVKTETHSDGWGDKVYITSRETDEGDIVWDSLINPTGEIEKVTLDSDYTEFLPSLNLTFRVTDTFYVRTAAYRSMSRFQMNAMSAGVSYETCENEDDTICDPATNTDYSQVIRGGEANGNHLDPYTADNYDLSLEYYPSEDAAISLALYYKSFTGGYETLTEQRDITVNLDGTDSEYSDVSHIVKQTSDDESVIKGFEISAQKHFVELPAPFNGLGAKVAWNHADSDFVTDEPASPGIVPDANLFGFSEDVASASVYWEGDDTTVRLMWKYRSEYLQPNNLPFPDGSHRYVQDATYLNMSAKYKINSNVSLFLKGLNLTNEPQVMTRGNDSTIADYSRSGTKWEFGVKAKF